MSEDGAAGREQGAVNPWMRVGEKYPVGSRVPGKVIAILDSGVLVQIEEGVEGLIAFSDPSLSKVSNPAALLEVGDEVEAIVSELDMDQRRVSLSLRRINP